MKQRMVRLDRIAAEMNGWLLALAIGLGMLDLTVLVAKCLPPLPHTPIAVSDTSTGHPAQAPGFRCLPRRGTDNKAIAPRGGVVMCVGRASSLTDLRLKDF